MAIILPNKAYIKFVTKNIQNMKKNIKLMKCYVIIPNIGLNSQEILSNTKYEYRVPNVTIIVKFYMQKINGILNEIN